LKIFISIAVLLIMCILGLHIYTKHRFSEVDSVILMDSSKISEDSIAIIELPFPYDFIINHKSEKEVDLWENEIRTACSSFSNDSVVRIRVDKKVNYALVQEVLLIIKQVKKKAIIEFYE
jgi:biopolymer transport protein ExbD